MVSTNISLFTKDMANRGPVYGLSRACQLKTKEKFNLDRAKEAIQWIEDVTGHSLKPSRGELRDEYDVAEVLKDGIALCELMNKINPGAIKRIHKQKTTFKEMENIELFIKACLNYDMNKVDIFQTLDLYEAKSVYSVVNAIHALGSLAKKNGFSGPTIGVKLADKKERHFTEEQIAEGNRVIGLQYGTNKVASQAGMTPYGLSRQILLSQTSVEERKLLESQLQQENSGGDNNLGNHVTDAAGSNENT